MHMDYDLVAATYNRRYKANPLSGVAAALRHVAEEARARRALEVGCGTGRWLEELQFAVSQVVGLDRSPGMLEQAHHRRGKLDLVCGDAGDLPISSNVFDLIYCVNAIHHFDDKEGSIRQATSCLRPGGVLCIIGIDPHNERNTYYVYEYFKETLPTDLKRFPSSGQIAAWMSAAGLQHISVTKVDHIHDSFEGEAVFDDPFLEKNAISQLTLLSDEAYQNGLERMRLAIQEAGRIDKPIVFLTDIEVQMIDGWKL
jgi:ubiquinone/menaquinone biosynthesis C-methylase UbiE